MPNIFENKERRVIPNFRSLKKTVKSGELGDNNKTKNIFLKNDLGEYFNDFKKNKTLAHASDLVSAALVNNLLEHKNVIDAAKFIIDNENNSTSAQREIATKILNIQIPQTPKLNINRIDEFLECNSLSIIYKRIQSLKLEILKFNRNPFLYSEIARLYSIIGQKESALKNIIIAKQLAPINRYILRSFSRLMAHYNEIEQAHDSLRKNVFTKFDPWLLASEIAFASLRKKTSNLIKIGIALIDSKNFNSFSLSELASSIATIELYNGNRKKSLSLFSTALKSPNDNSLAQVEWANNKNNLFDLDIKKFKVKNSFEAITLDSFNSQDWKKTIENAEEWFIDMPFTKRPIMFGHHVASFFLEDEQTAIKFCKAGLIANPHDPMIINNIAYSYAVTNNVNVAFDYLHKIRISEVAEENTQICLLATKGLSYYRDNKIELGRNYYIQAINRAKEIKNQYYYNLALMHFAREEILINSENSLDIYNRIMKINTTNKELLTMKDRISKIIEQRN